MNGKTQGAFLLLTSILLSSTLTYLLTKAKYEKKTVKQETVVPVKKSEPKQKTTDLQEKEDITKYAEKYKQTNAELTSRYSAAVEEPSSIEIIDDDRYGRLDDYDVVSWTIFADNVVVDDSKHVITDFDGSVGAETIARFDQLEHDNAVYIRNGDK